MHYMQLNLRAVIILAISTYLCSVLPSGNNTDRFEVPVLRCTQDEHTVAKSTRNSSSLQFSSSHTASLSIDSRGPEVYKKGLLNVSYIRNIRNHFMSHVTMLEMKPFHKQLRYIFFLANILWTTKGGTQTHYLSLCPWGCFPFCHRNPCRWCPLEPQGGGLRVRQPRHWLRPQRTPSRRDPSIKYESFSNWW